MIDFLDNNEAKNITLIAIIIIKEEIIKIIKIIYINFLNLIIGSYKYFLYYINFIFLISKLIQIKIIKQYLQSVNIKLLLRTQNDDFLKSDYLLTE